MVKHADDKVVGETTVHCLPTYKTVRAGRFANALLVITVILLLFKYLQIKDHQKVHDKTCTSAETRNCLGKRAVHRLPTYTLARAGRFTN